MAAKKKAAKKGSARKSAAGPSLDSTNAEERHEARQQAGEEAAKAPPERKVDPDSVPASAEEQEKVRQGDAKADKSKSAPIPATRAPTAPAPTEERVATADPSLAKVVDITAENKKLKGYREEEVVATRLGHYDQKRRRPGEVFTMGLVGEGYLPSWVRKANEADTAPGVAQSRQVGRTSSSQEIMDDARADSGTEVPLSLGGGQRRNVIPGNPRTVI